MAVLSAFAIIRALAILHLTMAYYLLTNPKVIADQNLVWLLGSSMDMPMVSDFNKASNVTAFAALLLTFLGLSDLVSVSVDEPTAVEYWSAVTPLRLVFLFPLTGYIIIYQPTYLGGVVKSRPVGDLLKNGFTFTWCFLETVMWFWVYVSLKEQRKAAAERVLKRQKEQML